MIAKVITMLVLMIVINDCQAQNWQSQRMDMIEEVQADMRAFIGHPLSGAVEKALRNVERHRFVPVNLARSAYDNRPLPIGSDQTISQPFIVALMTDLLNLQSTDRVLEVGTGSGYQAAVLAEVCAEVYTVEIIGALASEATERLQRLGYSNVYVRHGDGTKGWPVHAPFDGIMVPAAGLKIPQELLDQLKPGGRLVMPVGGVLDVQQLKVIERTASGFSEREIIPVRFVPITHDVR